MGGDEGGDRLPHLRAQDQVPVAQLGEMDVLSSVERRYGVPTFPPELAARDDERRALDRGNRNAAFTFGARE